MLDAFKKFVGIPTEEFCEGGLTPDCVNLRLAGHHGMLSTPSCIAFQPAQRILAVGSNASALIKLYGRPSVEKLLAPPRSTKDIGPVLHLYFAQHSLLCAVHPHEIVVWDYDKSKIVHRQHFPDRITASSYYPYSDCIFVGLETGQTQVLNTEKFYMSTYEISNEDVVLKNYQTPKEIVAFAKRPESESVILILRRMLLIEWDIKQRKVIKSYIPPAETCIVTYSPSGSKFATGHANGDILIWKSKTNKSIGRFKVTDMGGPRAPIQRIIWTTINGSKAFVVLGGQPTSEESRILLRIENHNVFSITALGLGNPTARVTDLLLSYAEPSQPNALISITNDGALYVNTLLSQTKEVAKQTGIKGRFAEISQPPSFALHLSPVLQARTYNCPKPLLAHLRKTCNITWSSGAAWPLTGGRFPTNVKGLRAKIMITTQANGLLCLWDASINYMCLLSSIPIDISLGVITEFSFCTASRVLVVGTKLGHVMVFEYSLEERELKPILFDANPKPVASKEKEPELSTTTVDAKTPEQVKENTSAEKKNENEPVTAKEESKQVEKVTEAKTEHNEAAKEEKSQVEQAIKVDPPKEPATPKEEPQATAEQKSEKVEPASPSPVDNKAKNQTEQEAPTDKGETKVVAPKQQNDSTQGDAQPAKASKPTSQPPQKQNYKCFPGFQLAQHFKFGAHITALTHESDIGRLAIGDVNGKIWIFDTTKPGSSLASAMLMSHQLAKGPIKRLLFASVAKPQEPTGTRKRSSISTHEEVGAPLLLLFATIAMPENKVVVLNLSKSTVKTLPTLKGEILTTEILQGQGKPIALPQKAWKAKGKQPAMQNSQNKAMKKSQKKAEATPTKSPRSGDTSPKSTASPRKTSATKPGGNRTPAPIDVKPGVAAPVDTINRAQYIFVGTSQMAAIIKLDNFTVRKSVEYENTVVSHSVFYVQLSVSRVECCVMSVRDDGVFLCNKLLSLDPVQLPKNTNLTNFGIRAKVIHHTCSPDGLTFVLCENGEVHRIATFDANNANLVAPAVYNPEVSPRTPRTGKRRKRLFSGGADKQQQLKAILSQSREAPKADKKPSPRQEMHIAKSTKSVKASEKRSPRQEAAANIKSTKQNVAETKNIMHQNVELLNERGDHINQLQDKTAEMENQAADFLAAARQLRQQSEKKWYEF